MPFTQETIDFMLENHYQDSRKWFEEHKKEYRRFLIEPMRDLSIDLTSAMLEIDDQFVTEPRIDKTISRIWRDLRYTNDPHLYRDNMWLIFKRDRMHSTEYPGVYFEFSATGFDYGCGFYHASTSTMRQMRSMILEDTLTFRRAQKAYLGQSVFRMEGETYKKPHYPGNKPEIGEWLERRNIGFSAQSEDMDLLFSPDLAQKLAEDLKLLAPVYRFLLEAAQADHNEHPYRN